MAAATHRSRPFQTPYTAVSAAACLLMAAACSSDSASPRATPNPKVPFPGTYVIEVTGSDRRWQVHYPGLAPARPGKRVSGARNIHVPLGTRVVLLLKSRDYVYTLAIPDFGLKEIAVPQHEFQLEFRPKQAGRVELVGEHLCGDPFTELDGELVIVPQERFRDWLRQTPAAVPPP